MYIDGPSNKNGSGVGIILRTTERTKIERTVSYGFLASNNEAKYEALVIGLQLARVCGATNLNAFCDS